MATKTDRREQARQKAADRRAEQQRSRTRRMWLVGSAVVIVLTVVTTITVTALNHGDDTAPTASGVTSAPPWPAPADAAARAKAAGLKVAGMEGAALHTHQHLSVSVDGTPVAVPANIGVQQGGMSALHTHDTSGIVHVESAKVQPFTLGQLFTEWNVAVRDGQVGGYVDGKNGRHVAVFVNGTRSSTPLPDLKLQDQQDIAIVITRGAGTPIAPTPFDWSTAS